MGNLIDRVLLGHVVDFISLHYEYRYWPAFNLADSAITLGAGWWLIDAFCGCTSPTKEAPVS
jgi:signal peptidase II